MTPGETYWLASDIWALGYYRPWTFWEVLGMVGVMAYLDAGIAIGAP